MGSEADGELLPDLSVVVRQHMFRVGVETDNAVYLNVDAGLFRDLTDDGVSNAFADIVAATGQRRVARASRIGPAPRGMPYPENLDNHFVVDPAKFDFYAMDCYRLVGEDNLARTLAEEVLRAGTDFDGTERSPMRNAEARVTLGVTAAREGDLEQALIMGERALVGDRQSVPALIMTSRELAAGMRRRYASEPGAQDYLARLRDLGQARPGFLPQ